MVSRSENKRKIKSKCFYNCDDGELNGGMQMPFMRLVNLSIESNKANDVRMNWIGTFN